MRIRKISDKEWSLTLFRTNATPQRREERTIKTLRLCDFALPQKVPKPAAALPVQAALGLKEEVQPRVNPLHIVNIPVFAREKAPEIKSKSEAGFDKQFYAGPKIERNISAAVV